MFTPINPKIFYHLSPTRDISRLRPSIPRDAEDKSDTPRVCVCPSVALAYEASGLDCLNLPYADIHVYVIHQVPDVTPNKAFELGTEDALNFREHWYLTDVHCEYIGTLAQWYASRG